MIKIVINNSAYLWISSNSDSGKSDPSTFLSISVCVAIRSAISFVLTGDSITMVWMGYPCKRISEVLFRTLIEG